MLSTIWCVLSPIVRLSVHPSDMQVDQAKKLKLG